MTIVTQLSYIFFFNDTATTEIYTLSLHDALPIFSTVPSFDTGNEIKAGTSMSAPYVAGLAACLMSALRSEEHTSELQSLAYLVCRLLLEKKKKIPIYDGVITRSWRDAF